MAHEDIKAAFQHAAIDLARLDHIGLKYSNNAQVITATGWHADGTPFATATAPFDGDPGERARQLAIDLIRAHGAAPQPRSKLQMSQKGSGLARLMAGLKGADDRADTLATKLETALNDLHGEMATTEAIVGNVEKSVEDLRAVNRLYSNGDPTSDGSAASSVAQP